LPEFRNDDSLRGIEEFSHLWLIFDFSKSHKQDWSPLIRPPRLGGNEKVGVFASRSPFRPNSLGLSSVKLIKKETTKNDGTVLYVSGADLIDQTPIFDIKPYIPHSDCHTDAKGSFADAQQDYKLKVDFPESLSKLIPNDKLQGLIECLADDPRPSYHDDGRVYGMTYSKYNVKFSVKDKILSVLEIK
jgi:tRNA-Thr(GGU) m(6)t(6)A37 methyltransferase TsaA